MDRDQLEAFDRIAKESSFTRAAISLGIGQPAISARIRALEQDVGGTLFRRGRHITLTALGESFLPFARRALEVLGEGVEAARLAQVGQRGRIRLGTLASLASGLVGPALGAFVHANRLVDCVVRAGDHERIVALLVDGIVDLGVVAWPCTEMAAADLQPLLRFREPVVLVARAGHPLTRRTVATQDDVVRLGRPIFRLRWWQRHDPLILELAERGGPAMDLPMETARRLAMAGAGVGFFARMYVADDLESGALVEVRVRDLPRIFRDSALVRRAHSGPLSPATANLIEAIRRQAVTLDLLSVGSRGMRGSKGRSTPRNNRRLTHPFSKP